MQIDELLKKVHRLEIKTKALSKHLLSGEYHSAFKGRGMSFSEVRSYQYGDDVRSMDWNVTARTGAPHIKVFEEERELTLLLAIDMSQSVFFGSEVAEKQALIAEIAAVLAFSALQNNDKVGLLLFSEKIEKYIAPKKGKAHILYILRFLLSFEPSAKKTDINTGLDFLQSVLKKRSICFVLSDFMDKNYEKSVRIAARRHDLIGIQITDKLESQIPSLGLINAEDSETGEQYWFDTSDTFFQKAYTENFQTIVAYFESTFKKNAADTLHIRTSERYIDALLGFFKRRK